MSFDVQGDGDFSIYVEKSVQEDRIINMEVHSQAVKETSMCREKTFHLKIIGTEAVPSAELWDMTGILIPMAKSVEESLKLPSDQYLSWIVKAEKHRNNNYLFVNIILYRRRNDDTALKIKQLFDQVAISGKEIYLVTNIDFDSICEKSSLVESVAYIVGEFNKPYRPHDYIYTNGIQWFHRLD
jgi:hypothetical protein